MGFWALVHTQAPAELSGQSAVVSPDSPRAKKRKMCGTPRNGSPERVNTPNPKYPEP